MDSHTLGLLIPILALSIPVTAIVFNGWQKVARMRLEEAKLRASGGEMGGEVAVRRDEVAALRAELSEVQERLDFTERLLTKARDESR
jgi:hypothetical protein